MDATSVIAMIGGIALLIGIFGGGVKAKEVEIPLIPGFVRLLSSITGIALLGIAIWLSIRATPPIASTNSTGAPTSTPSLAPLEKQTTQPNANIFTLDFNGSNGSYDKNVWGCTSGSCDQLNVFQQDGALVFKFASSDTFGGIMKSLATWKPENLISVEGKVKLGSGTRGGAWLGVDSQGWQGLDKGVNCSISIKPEASAPHIGCNVGPDLNKVYMSDDFPVRYDTWYLMRIDFDPTTQAQRYYVDDQLIGQYMPKISKDYVSLILGVWKEGSGPVEAYVDDIVVRTRP